MYKEAVAVAQPDRVVPRSSATKRSLPSSAANKPISLRGHGDRGKNEVFVDLIERLTILFNSSGSVLRSEINGMIQMKSFLQGSPGALLRRAVSSLGCLLHVLGARQRGFFFVATAACLLFEPPYACAPAPDMT